MPVVVVVVVVTLRLPRERFDVPAAQQAPVQTATQMTMMQIAMQMSGARTATIMPTMAPADKATLEK